MRLAPGGILAQRVLELAGTFTRPRAARKEREMANMGRAKNIARVIRLAIMITALTNCQSMTGETAGETLDDTSITTAVKAKLAAEKVSTLTSIGVATNLRIVHLTGVIETEALRQRASELARGVKGVRDVTNDITVRTSQ